MGTQIAKKKKYSPISIYRYEWVASAGEKVHYKSPEFKSFKTCLHDIFLAKGKESGKFFRIDTDNWEYFNQSTTKKIAKSKTISLNTINSKYGLFSRGIKRFFKKFNRFDSEKMVTLPKRM